MGVKLAAALVGLVFGFTLTWSGLTDPATIRAGLLFEQSYLYLFFAAALGTAFAGTQILRRLRPRALLTGEPVEFPTERPTRFRLTGATLFGVGWGISGACPGPIAAQLGQGIGWSLLILAGVVLGIVAYLRLDGRERSGAAGAPGRRADAQPAPP